MEASKKLFAVTASFLLILGLAGCTSTTVEPTTELSLVGGSTYAPGDEITVNYSIVEEIQDNAWLGVIPADVEHGTAAAAEAADVAYQYLNGSSNGSMTFNAPAVPGDYDFRVLNSSAADGLELGYVTFTVEANELPEADYSETGASVTLEETSFAPGAEVTVSYVVPEGYGSSAWVGVIPSSVPHGDESVNDQYDVAYQYLEEGSTEGTLTFTAPSEAGEYDFRVHDTDGGGNEVAYVRFTVE